MELLIGAAAAGIITGINHHMKRKDREVADKIEKAAREVAKAKRDRDDANRKMVEAAREVAEAKRDRDDANRKMLEAIRGEDGKGFLRRNIENLKKKLERNDTELKLRARQMELHEKKMELYNAADTRELEYCMIKLEDGVVPLERDHEVEENECKMNDEIDKELQEISCELEEIKRWEV